jgi:HlyD family secretion protein
MPEEKGNFKTVALTLDAPLCVPSTSARKSVTRHDFEPPHKNRRIQWLLAGAVIVLILGSGAYWMTRNTGPAHYVTTPVTRGIVARTVSASGTVNPILTIIVGSYVSGVIQEQYADYNTQVKKGQLCAKIDPRPYQTVVDQNKADLAMAKAQLQKDKANLAYGKVTYSTSAMPGF